jgi:hypothetical protein
MTGGQSAETDGVSFIQHMRRDMHHIFRTVREKWRESASITLLAAISALIAAPHMATVEPQALPTAVISATERVGEIPVEVATNTASASERHMGFDTNVYPGDKAMAAWKASGKYEWVGYYLPAPCHKDASWSGKRERLVQMGWGMAVIYVGQQTWGRTPHPSSKAGQRAARSGEMSCNADLVSGDRGTRDGEDAATKAAAEGFPRGTVVFLDVERMETMPQAMRDYYRAWAARVLADGRYRPGVYVHAHNAETVHDDLKAVFASAGNTEEPTIWVASGHNFSRDKAPTDVGQAFADVWQGMLDIVESNNGVKLPIDVNVAAVPSPSDQYAITSD